MWSAKRIAALKLSPEERASKLREGVSIYYNVSSKGRSQWNGLNTAKLPVETQRHIAMWLSKQAGNPPLAANS